MSAVKHCSKCGGEMVKGTESGYFAVIEVVNSEMSEITSTDDYMCTECGFIEIYGVNPHFSKNK